MDKTLEKTTLERKNVLDFLIYFLEIECFGHRKIKENVLFRLTSVVHPAKMASVCMVSVVL